MANGDKKDRRIQLDMKRLIDFKDIEWTQEREDFLKQVFDKFTETNARLNQFLGSMDNHNIDLLISQSSTLKLIS